MFEFPREFLFVGSAFFKFPFLLENPMYWEDSSLLYIKGPNEILISSKLEALFTVVCARFDSTLLVYSQYTIFFFSFFWLSGCLYAPQLWSDKIIHHITPAPASTSDPNLLFRLIKERNPECPTMINTLLHYLQDMLLKRCPMFSL